MIAHLTGKLLSKKPNSVVVDVHGVGYEVNIPLSTFYDLGEEGSTVSLLVYTYVRDDTIALYGFRTAREKEIFEKLINVQGVGPRLGIILLSGATVDELIRSVLTNDLHRLMSIPGVGKKTAERIVLELKDKLGKLAATDEVKAPAIAPEARALKEDVVSALVNLGYQKSAAERAVSAALADKGRELAFEEILKRSLRILAG